MNQEVVDGLLLRLDGSGSDDEWAAVAELRQLGAQLPGLLHRQYRRAKSAGARSSCVYHSMRYARESDEAVSLGVEALRDRAKNVRYRACMLLAYSLHRSVLQSLRDALNDPKLATSKEDMEAAIDAIEEQNSNYFVDRKHTGNITLNIH